MGITFEKPVALGAARRYPAAMMLRALLALTLLATAAAASDAQALDLQRRRMLTAAEHKEWRAVGRVNIEIRSDMRSMCTGTLIAPDLVLTAAHCVVSELTGLPYPPGNVHFVAGWRLGVKVAHSLAAKVAVHPRYSAGKESVRDSVPYDLALIRLATPMPPDKVAPFDIAPAFEGSVTLVSYRQDRPNALTRQDGCAISRIRGAVVQLGCEVTFGASGSPLFQTVNGEERVTAVLSAMHMERGRIQASAVSVAAAIGPVLEKLD